MPAASGAEPSVRTLSQETAAAFGCAYDWANRIGANSARPYLYEGTIAHEFQHLIHSDVDSNEDSFIDEGMADMAEQFLYGTKTTSSHIGDYLVYHRDSLIDWDGELYDYGGSVLWQDYLWEKKGGTVLGAPLANRVAKGYENKKFAETPKKFKDPGDAFIWNLIHEQTNGLAGVATWVGGMAQVKSLHHDHTLANLLDGKASEPKWNYRNLALGGPDSDGYSIGDGLAYYDANVSGNMPPTRKNVYRRAFTEAWGAYYRAYGGAEPGFRMTFSGEASNGVAPHSAPWEWYAGLGNMLQRTLERKVPAGSVLAFWTWYDIEPDWDYGYVEASSDGSNWVKLPQLSTLRVGTANPNGSSAWDGVGGFTDNSGGWQEARFDVSGIPAGGDGTVYLRFRYATDEASNGQGWYVDDVTVGAFSDPVSSTTGWTTNGWSFTDGLQQNDWMADIYAPYAKASKTWYSVLPLSLSVQGSAFVGSQYVPAQYLKSGQVIGVVSNRPTGVFEAIGRLSISKDK